MEINVKEWQNLGKELLQKIEKMPQIEVNEAVEDIDCTDEIEDWEWNIEITDDDKIWWPPVMKNLNKDALANLASFFKKLMPLSQFSKEHSELSVLPELNVEISNLSQKIDRLYDFEMKYLKEWSVKQEDYFRKLESISKEWERAFSELEKSAQAIMAAHEDFLENVEELQEEIDSALEEAQELGEYLKEEAEDHQAEIERSEAELQRKKYFEPVSKSFESVEKIFWELEPLENSLIELEDFLVDKNIFRKVSIAKIMTTLGDIFHKIDTSVEKIKNEID